jgi:hypothetical protein
MRAARQKSGSPLGSERGGDLLHSEGHAVAGPDLAGLRSALVFHIDQYGLRHGNFRGGDGLRSQSDLDHR